MLKLALRIAKLIVVPQLLLGVCTNSNMKIHFMFNSLAAVFTQYLEILVQHVCYGNQGITFFHLQFLYVIAYTHSNFLNGIGHID